MTTTAEALERIAIALEKLADRRPALPSGVHKVEEMLNRAADLAVEAEADLDESNEMMIANAQARATLALAWAQMASASNA